MMDRRIGAQLYTVRDLCKTAADYERTIERLAKIGYKTVQVSGVGADITAAELKRVNDKFGMEVICTHKGLADYEERPDDMITFHNELGCKIAGLGMYRFEKDASADDVRSVIERLNKVTRELRAGGLDFCYHNHASEFVKIDGRYIMDYMLEYGEFNFIVDAYWLAVAGQDPAGFIRRIGKRAKVVHFKDLKIVDNAPVFSEVGEGNLDWAAITAACDDAGTIAAMVEQDICSGDPVESLEVSYRNLTKLGFN